MSLIAWIIVGGIAGWLASLIMKTDDQMGCVTNIIVGMVGSIIGGAIVVFLNTGSLDFTTAFNNLNVTSILVSTLGAIVLLAVVRFFQGRA